MKSKAILEFDYPQDEQLLRMALNGERAIKALHDIYQLLLQKKYQPSKEAALQALKDCGETNV